MCERVRRGVSEEDDDGLFVTGDDGVDALELCEGLRWLDMFLCTRCWYGMGRCWSLEVSGGVFDDLVLACWHAQIWAAVLLFIYYSSLLQ